MNRQVERAHVLLVEDEQQLLALTEALLDERGYEVTTAKDGESALEALRQTTFDLVILDLNLPDLDGLEVLSSFRENSQVPVIIVSARTDGKDRIDAFDRGADDYLTKPFLPKELLARMNVCLRRNPPAKPKKSGEFFKIDEESQRLTLGGTQVELTSREFSLLQALATEPGKVYSRQDLLKMVWGADTNLDGRRVDLYVSRLRAKLESFDSKEIISSVYGEGYKLDLSEHP